MEFRLDEGQVELQSTARRFCATRFPLDRAGEREGSPVDRVVWKELGDLGVLGVLAPERAGGSGLGAVEAAVALEQLAAHLAPVPVLWSVLAAPLVEGVAPGDRLVGGVEDRSADGEPLVIEHAGDLDALLVLRSSGVYLVDGHHLPDPQPLVPFDPLTPVGGLDALPPGEQIGDAAEGARLRLLGTALSAAMLLGLADRALDVARDHAQERRQFGVPIGSFQAVKHILADMYVRTAQARSATYAAAAVIDDPAVGDQARTVAGAKLLAGEAAVANAGAAVQVLGGMGFTWAMPPHYLLKRAWLLDQGFGTADDHALAIGSALGGDGA